ncbi:hypothetical protein AXG93_977s1270 [Marchantia polymorpha subsp. ruderalis]|uniref:Proteasome endopeptidase complex n=1 Tax=Marchantia polymorpha subsp. ruderalis TaxID=1480154 RepID=A0A176WD32_MARPO|nr:hypothetical protein AXG93_977s1270 [Marchantia polymorpha subsp. ruderalis]
MEIDAHVGCAVSGLTADAPSLVEHGRVEAQNHKFSYNEAMSVKSIVQALCDLALSFGEAADEEPSMSRPFGVALLIAGHDETGPCLYHTDPSGSSWACDAKAIGSGSEGANSSLQEHYHKDMTLKEAETLALSTLKHVMEEKAEGDGLVPEAELVKVLYRRPRSSLRFARDIPFLIVCCGGGGGAGEKALVAIWNVSFPGL